VTAGHDRVTYDRFAVLKHVLDAIRATRATDLIVVVVTDSPDGPAHRRRSRGRRSARYSMLAVGAALRSIYEEVVRP
jgi:hypothetical protein